MVPPERTYREQSLPDLERQLGAEFERYYDSERTGDRSDLVDYTLGQQHIPRTKHLSPN
jgi:hypothetical protein